MTARTGVIVVAGGSGRRLGGDVPKQFRLLGGQPVLARTINLFAEALPGLDAIAVGPTLSDVHTPDESMELASSERFYELLVDVLARLAK